MFIPWAFLLLLFFFFLLSNERLYFRLRHLWCRVQKLCLFIWYYFHPPSLTSQKASFIDLETQTSENQNKQPVAVPTTSGATDVTKAKMAKFYPSPDRSSRGLSHQKSPSMLTLTNQDDAPQAIKVDAETLQDDFGHKETFQVRFQVGASQNWSCVRCGRFLDAAFQLEKDQYGINQVPKVVWRAVCSSCSNHFHQVYSQTSRSQIGLGKHQSPSSQWATFTGGSNISLARTHEGRPEINRHADPYLAASQIKNFAESSSCQMPTNPFPFPQAWNVKNKSALDIDKEGSHFSRTNYLERGGGARFTGKKSSSSDQVSRQTYRSFEDHLHYPKEF